MAIKVEPKQQGEILSFIQNTVDQYRGLSEEYRDLNVDIYEALSTFEEPDTGLVRTRFKVNKAHEVVRKVVPKVFAKSPRFIVSARTDIFRDGQEKLQGEEQKEAKRMNEKMVLAIQDYLTTLFSREDLKENLKIWALNQVTYGNAFAEIVGKYTIQRSKIQTKAGQKVTEKVVEVLPTINNISWTEIFYDPRFRKIEDMPGIFRIRRNVRLQELEFAKGEDGKAKYYNLDQVESLAGQQFSNADSFKSTIWGVTGVSDIVIQDGIDKNALQLQSFYGKMSLTGDPMDERLYEISTVNFAVVIGIEEITQIPIVDIKGHEDPEVFFSTGFVAPLLGLQDEINFQKNAQATAMSKALNRSYYWAPDSGVDPSLLVGDKPGSIIVCTDGVEQAQRNLVEQVNNPLPSQYFNNINDYNRDVQNLTHTVDVSAPQGQQNLTNTATGARIQFFESNSVIGEFRKNFEKGASELAYKMLEWTVNNMDQNLIIKKADGKGFIEINKEALRNSLERYEIRVEANSSAFDELETRRNDAIALKNILLEAKQAGVNVNVEEGMKAILQTFEGFDLDKVIPPVEDALIAGLLPGAPPGGAPRGGTAGELPEATPAAITRDVAGGGTLFA